MFRALRNPVIRTNLFLISLFAACVFMGSCGGTPSTTNPTPPMPTTGGWAILNGSTLSGATSHWESQDCNIKVEFASNSWMIYSASGLGTTHATVSAITTWSAGTTDKDVTIPVPSPAMFEFYLTDLKGIDGTTSSGTFQADVAILDTAVGTQVTTCPFVLQTGPIPGFSTSH